MDKEEKKIIKSFNNSIIDEKKNNTDYLILVWGLSFIILVIVTFIVGFVQNMDKPNLIPWVIYFVVGILIFIYRYIKTKKQRFIISIIFSLIIIFGLILYINKKWAFFYKFLLNSDILFSKVILCYLLKMQL